MTASIFGFFVVDKPRGMTSHDIVAGVRRGLRIRRVGHAGTLDPMATGVLVICLGTATRLSEYVMASRKTYRTTVRLGVETDSYDSEGRLVSEANTDHLTIDSVRAALERFQGEIDQIPPMFSAIKQGGVKLYDLARQGESVERAPRRVWVEIRLIAARLPDVDLEIECSAGTYIRSIAHDLGADLGVGGHLIALRRTRSGKAENPIVWDALQTVMADGSWPDHVQSERDLLAHLPSIALSAAQSDDILHGRQTLDDSTPAVDSESTATPSVYRAYTPEGRFIAILSRRGAYWMPDKVFTGEEQS